MSATIILATIIAYFVLLFSISWVAGRRADNTGFFSGGRKNHWFLVAMSTIGAPISAVTFVSVPGMVAASGMSYMQMVIGFTIGQLIIAFLLVPLYYKLNLTSIYEYLEQRFGAVSHKTGAWVFFLSKSTGAAVRLFIVCSVLQLLVFAPLGIPAWTNIIVTCSVVYLTTFRGGVKSLVWTDLLKTCSLLLSVVLGIVLILKSGLFGNLSALSSAYADSPLTRVFYFGDMGDPRNFWKQVIAGTVVLVAMTGLDQDMMQRTLSCRSARDSQKNILLGAFVQIVVIWLLLFLGFMLYSFAAEQGLFAGGIFSVNGQVLKGDDVFPYLATSGYFPILLGILFVVGFISSGYSSASGSLTALTTSFIIDILNIKKDAPNAQKVRNRVHILMAVLLGAMVGIIWLLNNESVINTVYRVASYTYGPLLGMFCFGIFTRWEVRDKWMPVVCILAPVLTFVLDYHSAEWFAGYTFSHERLLLNAIFTFLGMMVISKPKKQ